MKESFIYVLTVVLRSGNGASVNFVYADKQHGAETFNKLTAAFIGRNSENEENRGFSTSFIQDDTGAGIVLLDEISTILFKEHRQEVIVGSFGRAADETEQEETIAQSKPN